MAEQILRVEHLEKSYQKKHVLHDINFHVDKGEVVTLLGPSGSGKSTLIRCLNGLEEYQKGTITLRGKRLFQLRKLAADSPKDWHGFPKLRFVPQSDRDG